MKALFAALWKALGRPSPLIIESSRRMSDEELHALRAGLLDAFKGDRRGMPIVLVHGLRVVRLYTWRWLIGAFILGWTIGGLAVLVLAR